MNKETAAPASSRPYFIPDRLFGAQVTHRIHGHWLGVGRVIQLHPRNASYAVVRWENGWEFLEAKHQLRLAGY